MTAAGLVRVERNPLGPRVYVCGRRLHHATAAIVLAIVACAHDWQDRRDWFRLGN